MMTPPSLGRRPLLLLAVVVCLLHVPSSVVAGQPDENGVGGQWDLTVQTGGRPGPARPIYEEQIQQRRTTIRASYPGFHFSRDHIPSLQATCKSNATSAADVHYGFAAMMRRKQLASLAVESDGQTIQLIIDPHRTFQLIKSETVTCGPFTAPFVLNAVESIPVTSVVPAFSFVLQASQNPEVTIHDRGKKQEWVKRRVCYESVLRREGFELVFGIRGDLWKRDAAAKLAAAVSLEGGTEADQRAVKELLMAPKNGAYQSTVPYEVVFSASAESLRDFDVTQDVIVNIDVPAAAMLKGIEMDHSLSFTIKAQAVPKIVVVDQDTGDDRPTGGRMSLSCLLGRVDCRREVILRVADGYFNLSMSSRPLLRKLFSSTHFTSSMVAELVDPNAATLSDMPAVDLRRTVLVVPLAAMPRFPVITHPEDVKISVPSALMDGHELPVARAGAVLQLTVTPSPPVVTLHPAHRVIVPDVEVQDGGLEFQLSLQGDTWRLDEVRRSLVRLSKAPTASKSGWMAFRDAILPSSAITLSPDGSTVALAFQAAEGFHVMLGTEEPVAFTITAEMTTSGQIPEVNPLRQLDITFSHTQPRLESISVVPDDARANSRPDSVKESNMVKHGLTLHVQVTGTAWARSSDPNTFAERCVQPMVSRWVSRCEDCWLVFDAMTIQKVEHVSQRVIGITFASVVGGQGDVEVEIRVPQVCVDAPPMSTAKDEPGSSDQTPEAELPMLPGLAILTVVDDHDVKKQWRLKETYLQRRARKLAESRADEPGQQEQQQAAEPSDTASDVPGESGAAMDVPDGVDDTRYFGGASPTLFAAAVLCGSIVAVGGIVTMVVRRKGSGGRQSSHWDGLGGFN